MKKYDEAISLETVGKHAGNENLKTVFMLGDSMRMGCCEYTKRYLSDVANVFYPDDNCRYTQYTLVNLVPWANHLPNCDKVDLVYWNNGHWDIAHWDNEEESLNSISVYCDMLVRIYKKLKKLFPNAKILFSTTTPMNPKSSDWINRRSTEEIRQYNNAAVETLKNYDVEFFDAFGLLEDKTDSFYADFCHLTEEGFDFLGKQIADYIRSIL